VKKLCLPSALAASSANAAPVIGLFATAALAFGLATPAAAAPSPAGDWIQWYSVASYFDYANQTFEYATDIGLPTQATGVFAPFDGSTALVPFYGDGVGVDIPLQQLGSGATSSRSR
jgi:hypothetical protein